MYSEDLEEATYLGKGVVDADVDADGSNTIELSSSIHQKRTRVHTGIHLEAIRWSIT